MGYVIAISCVLVFTVICGLPWWGAILLTGAIWFFASAGIGPRGASK